MQFWLNCVNETEIILLLVLFLLWLGCSPYLIIFFSLGFYVNIDIIIHNSFSFRNQIHCRTFLTRDAKLKWFINLSFSADVLKDFKNIWMGLKNLWWVWYCNAARFFQLPLRPVSAAAGRDLGLLPHWHCSAEQKDSWRGVWNASGAGVDARCITHQPAICLVSSFFFFPSFFQSSCAQFKKKQQNHRRGRVARVPML